MRPSAMLPVLLTASGAFVSALAAADRDQRDISPTGLRATSVISTTHQDSRRTNRYWVAPVRNAGLTCIDNSIRAGGGKPTEICMTEGEALCVEYDYKPMGGRWQFGIKDSKLRLYDPKGEVIYEYCSDVTHVCIGEEHGFDPNRYSKERPYLTFYNEKTHAVVASLNCDGTDGKDNVNLGQSTMLKLMDNSDVGPYAGYPLTIVKFKKGQTEDPNDDNSLWDITVGETLPNLDLPSFVNFNADKCEWISYVDSFQELKRRITAATDSNPDNRAKIEICNDRPIVFEDIIDMSYKFFEISCPDSDCIFDLDGYSFVTAEQGADFAASFEGITIENGSSNQGRDAPLSNSLGGAFYVRALSRDMSTLTFSKCFLRNNVSRGGGAVASILATVEATETVFADNTASDGGGAITLAETSQSTFTDCKFQKNVASYSGGALRAFSSSPLLEGCEFSENEARYGGAVSTIRSGPTFNDCRFEKNVASFDGGAVRASSNSLLISTLMEGCEFSGNKARYQGGAIRTFRGSYIIRNCAFNENAATASSNADGGAIYMWDSDSSFEYSSFAGNSATRDGGAVTLRSATSSIENCHFTGNVAGDDGGALFTRLRSNIAVKNCFFEENTTGDDGGAIYTITTQSSLEEIHFINNSAGVDGGAIHVSNDCTSTMKKCLFDSNNANADGGAISLRDKCSLNGCRFDGNSAFLGGAIMSRSAANLTTEECDFTNNNALAGGGIVAEGISTLTNSRFEGNSAFSGGALWSGPLDINSAERSKTTINGARTLFKCNSATTSFSGGGGAILSTLADLSISDAEIIGNSALRSGGGIYLGINSTSLLNGCLFEQNIAGTVGGGAIASGELGPTSNTLTMYETVFHGNDVNFTGATSDDIFDFSLPSNSDFKCGDGYDNCFCDADPSATTMPNITTNDLPTICSGAGVGPTCDQSCSSSIRPVCNEPAPLPTNVMSGILSRAGDANAQDVDVWSILEKAVEDDDDDDDDDDEDSGEDARKYDEKIEEMNMDY